MENIEKEEIENLYRLIGKNVKKIREEKGKSQLDLALSIGHSSAGFVGKAEICIHNKHFNIEHLYKISKILNVDMCEFIKIQTSN
ncbi:helix-turn-helix domain-containing protein [Aliarcobacter butzleri]|uniref:helix-turn-helix domain-containing protein n=1 Tax=Aliarcobacter butzleri TaxID=28197 RepID=UPI00263CE97E|nr:helix-turn-helix transcriptional regulator [Aliarcobacter butzleri]MDN5092553.1 helix-turn-helix transcriptional regulator [Aliarcobacter butzleri]